MGGDLLDDLARGLAEPMPRRRALRLLGVSLAAVAVPGFRPRRAAGAVGTARAGECGRDVRTCPRMVQGAQGPDLCCGSPARRYRCEGTWFEPKCVDQCDGPADIPCTLSRKDPLGYAEFLCCKRPWQIGCRDGCVPNCRYTTGGVLCGKQCCRSGERCKAGQCVPPRCPTGESPCGATECCSRGERCVSPRAGRCEQCARGREACGRTCCEEGKFCCNAQRGICCSKADGKCSEDPDPICCEDGEGCRVAPGVQKCCSRNQRCAYQANRSGRLPPWPRSVCCPRERVIQHQGWAACCPPGLRASGSGAAATCG